MITSSNTTGMKNVNNKYNNTNLEKMQVQVATSHSDLEIDIPLDVDIDIDGVWECDGTVTIIMYNSVHEFHMEIPIYIAADEEERLGFTEFYPPYAQYYTTSNGEKIIYFYDRDPEYHLCSIIWSPGDDLGEELVRELENVFGPDLVVLDFQI